LSFARALPIALLLALAAPAGAQADATLSVTGTAPNKTLTFTVDDALDHTTSSSALSGNVVITDSVALAVGASGCIALDARTANCGPAAGFERVVFAFAGGDDDLGLGGYFPIAVSVDGGGGDDVLRGDTQGDELTGGPGDDELYGAGGDDILSGGAGDDYLEGGAGADTFDGGEGDDDLSTADTPAAADAAISCGAGDDVLLDYDDADPIDADCETIDPPNLDGDLQITGDPRVGNVLGLSLPANVGGDGKGTIRWERCNTSGYLCTDIAGAQAATYTLTAADLGLRLRAWYSVENALGDDSVESHPTVIVRAATQPPAPRPPRPTFQPPRLHVDPLKLTILPFATAGKPSFAVRKGRPVVDTGRRMACPGVAGGLPCKVHVVAYPSGASGRVHGRPKVAAESTVTVAAGSGARLRFALGRRAYALLRAHHKITLLINATITRSHSAPVRTSLTITVKVPPRKRR
jgi:RTX calcium-binding nonapeptide repeat (4 copies)